MSKTLVYQMYPIAWPGGLVQMTAHLEVVAHELGVDYVWLSPIYQSLRCDHGYDVMDYLRVDPRFGTENELNDFIAEAHRLKIGVLMDLILNHTSVKHKWFVEHPEYYCWRKKPIDGWRSLFERGEGAWRYDEKREQYYLSLFHREQADLNWFLKGGMINESLVDEFREIIKYWGYHFDVDGFRLDMPQALNKNFRKKELELADLLYGDKAVTVINEVFGYMADDLFLIMECFDPSMYELLDYYGKNTKVDFIMNECVKDAKSLREFEDNVRMAEMSEWFMMDTESHDGPRFPSRMGCQPKDALRMTFLTTADGLCLYQGQELGLLNPTEEELPDDQMIALDAQTAMNVKMGENIAKLRSKSRANARVPLPLHKYGKQEEDSESCYNFTKKEIEKWRELEGLH